MATTETDGYKFRWRDVCRLRSWADVVDFALLLWVIRVPLLSLVVGFALLTLVPQAQDLLVELVESRSRAIFYLLILSGVWAATTHYTARLLLDTDERFRAYAAQRRSDFLACQEIFVPRLLGALTFVAVYLSAERSIWNLPVIDDPGVIAAVTSGLRTFQFCIMLTLAFFVWYMVQRDRLSRSRIIGRIEASAGFVNTLLRRIGLRLNTSNLGPMMLVGVFLLCTGMMVASPLTVAEWFPRGLAIPLILGAWLPFLSFWSGLGRYYKAPLIVGMAMLVIALTFVFGDNYSVRRINAAEALGRPADTETISLNRAIDMWVEANGCANDLARCPRPIVVAAAGGASRAGFFTASVIGHFLDSAKERNPQLDERAVLNRLFAISGVSGGSVGAVMSVAAFARAGVDAKHPCAERKPDLWYGETIGGWRDCLEALMAGDFLTPTTVGLIFRDMMRFGWWQDRGTILERSWEERFAHLMKIDDAEWRQQCPGDLRCPFLTLRPSQQAWLPLLVLNGVSAASGRRIVTTLIGSNYEPTDKCPVEAALKATVDSKQKSPTVQRSAVRTPDVRCLIFLETAWFHRLLADESEPDWLGRIQRFVLWDYLRELLPFVSTAPALDDVRLSTAAHNSARFPVISPPGAVRNRKHQVVERIVDGGYFENYGALAAMEIALAIRIVKPELTPFVLVVSNDPDEDPDLTSIDAPDAVTFSDVSVPIEAFANTRTARGRLALYHLQSLMDSVTASACGDDTAQIRVWPQYRQTPGVESDKKVSRPVSMSWWLSRPIQILLHQQTENAKNDNQNQDHIARVWRALEATSDCKPARVADAK